MGNILEEVTAIRPLYRIRNREENLRFFCDILGLKAVLEEGAMIDLAGQNGRTIRLKLEESPASYGFRGVAGPHKRHRRTVLKAEASEIEQLLALHLERAERVFSGAAGLGAEFESPEKDWFLLYAGDDLGDLENLKELDKWELSLKLKSDKAFKGLSDVTVTAIELNVARKPRWQQEKVSFFIEKGADLTAVDTWDLESLELLVDEKTDLTEVPEMFEDYYLDAPKKILSVADKSGLELWFEK